MTNKNILITITFYVFLLLGFLGNKANAFNGSVVSIEQQLKKADTIRSSNPQKFTYLLNEIQKDNDLLSTNQAHYLNYLLAYQHSFSGHFEESIIKYKEIINSNANIELKLRANSAIVNIFAISQNWTEGLTHLSNNLTMLEQIKNKEIQLDALLVAVIFYNLIGQYDLGLSYAKIVQSETQNDRNLCFANNLILESKLHLQKLNENSEEVQSAIMSCEKVNEQIIVSLIRSYLAILNLDNNHTAKAINLLENALNEVENTKYVPLMAKYYSLLAKAYWLINNFNKSMEYAYKALSNIDGSGNTPPLISTHSILYKIELQRNNYSQALEHYIKYSEADKAHLEDEKNKHLAFQLAVHKELEQKNQINLLNKKNDLLLAEQALTKASAENTRFVLILLTVALSILLLWGYRLLKAHKRIKQLAEYDHLTGIFNRGHFTQVANTTLKYCENTSQLMSLIMFDLDYFKDINDSYGHASGDWTLKKVTEVCQKMGRQNDIFARLGGEEFCILLTGCDKTSALQQAEACRKAIIKINTEESGFKFFISASFGITDTKTSGYKLDQLLADADTATYSSKHIGRNQVSIFRPEMKKK